MAKLGISDGGLVSIKNMIFSVRSDPGCTDATLAFNLVQRKTLALSLNEPLTVEAWFLPNENIHISRIAMEADFPSKARATSDPIDAMELAKHCSTFFKGQVLRRFWINVDEPAPNLSSFSFGVEERLRWDMV